MHDLVGEVRRHAVVALAVAAVFAAGFVDSQPAPGTAGTTAPAATPAPSGNGLPQVVKGVTTQRDLLRLFGGPNLTTRDSAGREAWVYERTVAQTDSRSSGQSVAGGVDFGAFWSIASVEVQASKSQSSQTASAHSSVNTVTVIVSFAPDHTVADYEVRANYF